MSEKSFETLITNMLRRYSELSTPHPQNLVDNLTMAQFKQLAIKDTNDHMNFALEIEKLVIEYRAILEMEHDLMKRKSEFFQNSKIIEASLDNFETSMNATKEKLDKYDYEFVPPPKPMEKREITKQFAEPEYSTRPSRKIEIDKREDKENVESLSCSLDQSILNPTGGIIIDEKFIPRRLQFDETDDDDDEIQESKKPRPTLPTLPTPNPPSRSITSRDAGPPVFTSKFAQSLSKN